MTFTDDGGARSYGAGILRGDRVRLQALEDAELPDLVRWWQASEWAVLQQSV
jgi:hypothetical protein